MHDSCKPYSREVSEFLFTGNEMALRRDSLGELKGFAHMATYPYVLGIERTATADTRQALIHGVRRGLSGQPRSLSPWMFYDAGGSRLFECITTLPEYYPTRTERDILARHADAIVAAAHGDRTSPLRLVELGAGTAAKTVILLEAALRISDDVSYIPVDVSSDALELACQNIAYELPEVRIQPIVRNYITHPLQLEPFDGTNSPATTRALRRHDTRALHRHKHRQLFA